MALISRRQFVRISRTLSSLGLAGAVSRYAPINAWAQSGSDYKALVCVFLFGGNDSWNTVVPVSDQYTRYQNIRGNVAIPRANLLSMMTGAQELGLHPSLAAIHPLWQQGRLAIVTNVGMLVRPLTRDSYRNRTEPIPSSLFSHSDQILQWQSAPPNALPGTGWGGRAADRIQSMNAPSNFPPGVSLNGTSALLVGQTTQPANISAGSNGVLDGTDSSIESQARNLAVQELVDLTSGAVMIQAANSIMSEGLRVGQIIENATSGDNQLQTVFPGTGLGRQLEQVARLIQVRGDLGMSRQIFFCGMGGYDTHSSQLGRHAGLLAQLGDGVGAFNTAMQELAVDDDVTLFTESEFSRTFEPNGNAGTDHAWASTQFVAGGAVNGGQLYGRFPEYILSGPDDADSRGRFIPTVSLDMYGSTLSKWFGLNDADIAAVFPNLGNFDPSTHDLGFMT